MRGIAVASLYGIGVEELRETAAALEPGQMRGRHFSRDGIVHINDSYNSNPAAVEAAITPRTKALMPVHLAMRFADGGEHTDGGFNDLFQFLHLAGLRNACLYQRKICTGTELQQ